MRRHEVHVAPSAVYDGGVRLPGAEARLPAGDEPSQPADVEALAEVRGDLRDEGAANLIAADAHQGDAGLVAESTPLYSTA